MTARPLRIVLLSLTGFGRPVLQALRSDPRVELLAVFTDRQDDPFPYYREEHLRDTCKKAGVPVHDEVRASSTEGQKLLNMYAPDLIVVATFREIIPPAVLSIPRLGIVNFHPSLLPKYRGPCPIQAAIMNADSETGMTVHWLVSELDAGNILLQRPFPIDVDDTTPTLLQKLGAFAGSLIPDVIGLFAGGAPLKGTPQSGTSSRAPKPTSEQGFLETCLSAEDVWRRVRALHPIPGTSILVDGERVPIDRAGLLTGSRPDGLYADVSLIDLWINGHGVRLFRSSRQ